MKRLILMCGLLASGFSFGADWVFVAENQDGDTDHYIDSSYYNYSAKTGVSRVWYKVNKFNGLDEYTHTKSLVAYDCINKKERFLAQAIYSQDGQSLQNVDKPESSFRVIYPDTTGESLWMAACKTKGNGLYLPYKPNFISEKRMKLLGLRDEK